MRIGFSNNPQSGLSKLITRFTASEWSHTFLVREYISQINDYRITEATGSGVQNQLWSKYLDGKHGYIVFEALDTDYDISAIQKLMYTEYGYIQLIGIALAKLFRSTWNMFTDNTVCSEMVCRWLQASKHSELFKDLNPDYVSPEDLYRRIKQYPDIFKEVQL